MTDTGTPSPSSPVAGPSPAPETLAEILKTGRTRLWSLGGGYQSHAERLADLEKRLHEGRFHLAVLGQVKRGKSTLLNALLGEDVLPTGVVPLTAIPTFIQYGPERLLRVRYLDRRPDTVMKGETLKWLQTQLSGFVSEDNNPENEKGVREVEITHPAAILRDVVLIDTPGIGSTYRHNTEVTMNFLPQCDAALFIVSADPPITEVEVTFLREIRSRVAKLFFILNKVDYLTDDEREVALGFYRKILTRDAGIDPENRIFAVSARKALLAKEAHDTRLFEESGLAEVSDHLIAFLAREKNRVLREAVGKKACDILGNAALQIGLEMRALELPVEELEKRLALFDEKIAQAERQRLHAQDILLGDRKRVYDVVESYVRDLRVPLRERFTGIADDAIAASPQSPEVTAQQALAEVIPRWFEHELGTITTMTEREMTARLKEHEVRAESLIESVRTGAAELFEIPYHAPGGEEVYHLVRRPYWVDHEWGGNFSPITSAMIERILPGRLRQHRAKSRIKKQIDVLVIRNLENLRYETLQSVDTAFREYSANLDENLRLTIDATHGAIRAALEKRKQHASGSAEDLGRLKQAAEEIRNLVNRYSASA